MNFEFATATRIVFGPGRVRETATLAAGLGRRALVVSDSAMGPPAELLDLLKKAIVEAFSFEISDEPTTHAVLAAVRRAREAECDMVIGFGGGSVIDTGKAVAALITNAGELLDYLEVIGRGLSLSQPSAPYIAIPTTAGTGAEVTRNAVLASPEHRVKVSLRSPLILPRVALVDPELTYSLPPTITASTGLDALTQLIEPYVCSRPNPLTDAVCREGMRLAARSLRRAYGDGRDAAARGDMAVASLFGGLALANAGLGAVHGLAAPLGGMFPAGHGAVCARLLPFVMATNIAALETRAPHSPALARYEDVARILTGKATAPARDGVQWVTLLCADLAVVPLARFGITEAALPPIVAQAQKASSMKANPIPLTDTELVQILLQAL